MLAYHHSRDSPSEIVQMAPSKSLIMLIDRIPPRTHSWSIRPG